MIAGYLMRECEKNAENRSANFDIALIPWLFARRLKISTLGKRMGRPIRQCKYMNMFWDSESVSVFGHDRTILL